MHWLHTPTGRKVTYATGGALVLTMSFGTLAAIDSEDTTQTAATGHVAGDKDGPAKSKADRESGRDRAKSHKQVDRKRVKRPAARQAPRMSVPQVPPALAAPQPVQFVPVEVPVGFEVPKTLELPDGFELPRTLERPRPERVAKALRAALDHEVGERLSASHESIEQLIDTGMRMLEDGDVELPEALERAKPERVAKPMRVVDREVGERLSAGHESIERLIDAGRRMLEHGTADRGASLEQLIRAGRAALEVGPERHFGDVERPERDFEDALRAKAKRIKAERAKAERAEAERAEAERAKAEQAKVQRAVREVAKDVRSAAKQVDRTAKRVEKLADTVADVVELPDRTARKAVKTFTRAVSETVHVDRSAPARAIVHDHAPMPVIEPDVQPYYGAPGTVHIMDGGPQVMDGLAR